MEDGMYIVSELTPNKVEKRNPAIEYLLAGAIMAGVIVSTNAIDSDNKQHILDKGGVVVTSKVYEQELRDHTTGKRYNIVQETERNPWDNLDYHVRTGKLVLEETE